VFPSKPVALFWAEAAIKQNHGNVPQAIRIGFDGGLTPILGSDAIQGKPVPFQNSFSDGLRRFQIACLFGGVQNPFPAPVQKECIDADYWCTERTGPFGD
jgi:hypothetical protein